jgi:hypothetical protein
MSKEVTPPVHLFFRDEEELQDGDCGPASVIGALYYVYCLSTGVTSNVPSQSAVCHDAPTAPVIALTSADRHYPNRRLADGDIEPPKLYVNKFRD